MLFTPVDWNRAHVAQNKLIYIITETGEKSTGKWKDISCVFYDFRYNNPGTIMNFDL
jgi:hypothetical protein